MKSQRTKVKLAISKYFINEVINAILLRLATTRFQTIECIKLTLTIVFSLIKDEISNLLDEKYIFYNEILHYNA